MKKVQNMQKMQSMQNMQNMQSMQRMPGMQNMQNIQNMHREESRDESIAWRHLFTLHGNNDDKSEIIDMNTRGHRYTCSWCKRLDRNEYQSL